MDLKRKIGKKPENLFIFPKIGHLWIFLDSEQERLEPANGGLDVRVEEDQDVGGRGSNPVCEVIKQFSIRLDREI